MKPTYVVILIALLTVVSLAACSAESTPMPEDAQPQNESESPMEDAYPEPAGVQEPIERSTEQDGDPYPEPAASDSDQPQQELPEAVPPPSDHEYAPISGDEALTPGNVFIDIYEVNLLESYPVQVELVLIGNLPTPCHQLRAIASPADGQNRIQVEVYSLTDPDMICTQVLDPFEARVPLGAYSEGAFTVLVNGEVVGSFELP